MQVSIDISPAVNGKAGLGRYAQSLALELVRQHPQSIHLFSNIADDGELSEVFADTPRTTIKMGYKPWRLAILSGQITSMRFERLLPKGIELFHSTEHLLLPTRRIPAVLTVHDLIFKLFPEYHKRLNYSFLNFAMPIFARRAEHIIAVSQSTKDDLITHYRIPEDKITVIYEAAAPHFEPPSEEQLKHVQQKYSLPNQYVVTVGTIEPRKNLARLVEAVARLRIDWPDLYLVVVGSDGWLTDYFYDALAKNDAYSFVVRPGYIPDEDLPALIAGAQVSVTPSLYEGFGLPVLEAMAVGVPVACSNVSSLPEIAGDAAVFFDPYSVDAIMAAIQQIMQYDDLSREMIQRGMSRASEFSWERAAQETWAVYKKVLQHNTATRRS